jgi:[acyl-carrier-protein] S-malonyltransferase
MKKSGIIFPGQGSQKVGMGKDLYDADPSVKEMFDLANKILGRDITSICFEGPKETLTLTANAQPCIFLVSIILFERLKKILPTPTFLAGHSLGEITAYVAAGAIDFETALRVIDKRGRAMANAFPSEKSAMAAVIGKSPDEIRALISEFAEAPVVAANLNAPTQTVISGEIEGVQAAIAKLKENGAKVIPLNVSGAFHSPLMGPASDELSIFLQDIKFRNAQIPIILNRTATAETSASELKENLPLQVISSVRWTESIETMASSVDMIIECGPGRVLSGLAKKIDPSVSLLNISALEDQETVENALKEVVK